MQADKLCLLSVNCRDLHIEACEMDLESQHSLLSQIGMLWFQRMLITSWYAMLLAVWRQQQQQIRHSPGEEIYHHCVQICMALDILTAILSWLLQKIA